MPTFPGPFTVLCRREAVLGPCLSTGYAAPSVNLPEGHSWPFSLRGLSLGEPLVPRLKPPSEKERKRP